MEQFTYHDLSSILQFGEVKMKMEEYLTPVKRVLKAGLPSGKIRKKLDIEYEEYIVEYLRDRIELRVGFNWAHNDVHVVFELCVPHNKNLDDETLFANGWRYHLMGNYDVYYKLSKLTDFMNGYNGLEEEFAITEFLRSSCHQIIKALNVTTSYK